MKIIKYMSSPKARAWCKRHGYDHWKINRERLRNRVVVLYCDKIFEQKIWHITDTEYPVVIINPDGVWLKDGENPYK